MDAESLGLLKPKTLTIPTMDGGEIHVTLSRFPATVAREILCNYPLTALPKVGSYPDNEALMFKLMSYVAVEVNGQPMRLTTRALIDNHIPDAETLMRIEHAALEYNSSFFQSGRLSSFFDECVQMFLAKISQISTPSQPPLSKQK